MCNSSICRKERGILRWGKADGDGKMASLSFLLSLFLVLLVLHYIRISTPWKSTPSLLLPFIRNRRLCLRLVKSNVSMGAENVEKEGRKKRVNKNVRSKQLGH